MTEGSFPILADTWAQLCSGFSQVFLKGTPTGLTLPTMGPQVEKAGPLLPGNQISQATLPWQL